MARIVLLASYAPSLINFRGHLISELISRGHEVIAAAPQPAAEESSLIVRQLQAKGAQFVAVPLKNAGLNPMREWRTLRWLSRWFTEIQPDVVLGYTIKPVLWGSIAAHRAGVRDIYSIITGLGYAFLGETARQKIVGWVGQLLYRRALRVNRRVFFQNPDDRALFVERALVSTEKTIIVNGSGVDLEYYADCDPPQGRTVFLMCARLLRDKGVFEYLQAARMVKRQHPEAEFRLLGPFFDNPTAIQEEQLEEYRRDGTVEYLGAADDVRPHFAAASVYVLPSYREGTPRTVLEAMSMRRAIITTDVPGCRETVVDGENGYLVPARDPDALAEAMLRFVDDATLIDGMGQRSRALAEEKYDVHEVNRVIIETMGCSEP